MSWLSQFIHNPLDYAHKQPLKAGALAIPAALAAFFGGPAIGAAAGGIGSALGIGEAAGAAGAGAAGAEGGGLLSWLGLGGEAAGEGVAGGLAGAGAGAAEGGTSLSALLGLPEGAMSGEALSSFAAAAPGAEAGAVPGFAAAESAFPEFAAAGGEVAAGGEAAPLGLAGDLSGAGGGSAAGAGTEAMAQGGETGFLDQLVSGAKGQIMKNPLSTALAAGGLGYSMLQGQKVSPEMKAMSAEAQRLDAQGKELMSYLQSGTLPPGLKAGVDQATKAMKARIISNHARNGMSTDPSQNSALSQELNSVDMQALTLVAQQGVQLMNSGLSMSGLSTQLYGMLEKLNRDQAKSTGVAIANFAAALNGAGTRRAA